MDKLLGNLLRKARNQAGLSGAEAARRVARITGDTFTRNALSQIEKGETKNPKPGNLQALCDVYGISFRDALRGVLVESANSMPKHHEKNGNIAGARCDLVPLLSWASAESWQTLKSPMGTSQDRAEGVLCPVQAKGPKTFAVRIEGDSMISTHGRGYPPGTLIYVDPDVAPSNGKRVLALVEGSPTFKTYQEDAGKAFLVPLNPQYPTIVVGDSVEILGVVIGSFYED